MHVPPFMIVPVNRCWVLVAVVSGNKSREHKLYTTLCFVAPKIMIKNFSQFMCCLICVPGSYWVFAKDNNTDFYFLWLKSEKLQCKQGSRYWANDHKNTSVCFLQQTLFLVFVCAGEKLHMEGPGREEATGERGLSVCEGSGAGNSSHFCCWLDVWPWANHVSSMGLAPPCLSLCVIQNSVKCCCSDLIPFSIHSQCCTGVEKSQVLFAFFHLYLVGMISCYCWYSPSR